MPVYSFKCASGHTTQALRKYENRHDPFECACGEQATILPTVSAHGVVTGTANPVAPSVRSQEGEADEIRDRASKGWRPDRRADGEIFRNSKGEIAGWVKGSALVEVRWVCASDHYTTTEHTDEPPAVGPACGTCGAATRRKIELPALDAWTTSGLHATGGQWNASLGRWIKSPAHLREVCAEMQVRPSEEDSSELLRQAERKAKEDAEDREVFEMFQQEDASIKKARDHGLVPDDTWALKAVTAAHPDW